MTVKRIGRPGDDEHAPFYARYIARIAGDDPTAALGASLEPALTFLREIPESRWEHRYAPGKWTIKQLLGHVIDGERVFAYRALWFARGGDSPLPGFDEDEFVRQGPFEALEPAALVEELEHVRRSTISMFTNLDEAGWRRRGTANQQPISVRAIAYTIAGHAEHHFEVLRTRYL